ncbi:unnamed protein product [Dicrocoelium dendriticum]|nr:unnamed protein product [Dicrocoelium dendriticum]
MANTFRVWLLICCHELFQFSNYKDEIKRKVVLSFRSSFETASDDATDSYFAISLDKWCSSTSDAELKVVYLLTSSA